jgi:tryptophan 2,3-dioxygenase
MPLTYHSYLKLDELLSLQEIKSPDEHDELLFIIIHQTNELWFKQILHELDFVIRLLQSGDVSRTLHSLKRILTILKVLVHQIDILETMTPLEFLSFRDYLETASGFQSSQWRELEFLLGSKSVTHMQRFPHDSGSRKKLERRFREASLWDVFLNYLHNTGCNIPADILEKDSTLSTQPSREVRRVLLAIYQTDPALAQLCELLVDMDEGIQEWRYRHVKMVERTIGSKTGTGGAGVEYLKATLFKPLFPDLWAIRSEFSV